jgi:two-component system chemotaxis response regulator CheY
MRLVSGGLETDSSLKAMMCDRKHKSARIEAKMFQSMSSHMASPLLPLSDRYPELPESISPVRRPGRLSTMAIRVLVTDGSSMIRDAIRRHLECIGCDIVAEAETGEQALLLFGTVRPEIVTLGVEITYGAQSNPLDLVRLIKGELPETSVLIFAQDLARTEAEMFRRAGALECFIAPFEFAGLWRTLSVAHPELMAGAFAAMISTTAAMRSSRVSSGRVG